MFYQIQFKVIIPDLADEGEPIIYGGIGEYAENDRLVRVICGCCGGTFEPEDVKILDRYVFWENLLKTILGD